MSKIAVLSDIHGNLPALEAVIADAKARGCEHFINLGDILSGPLWPKETADYLRPLNWPTISGNHERQLLTMGDRMEESDRFADTALDEADRDWLRGLPAVIELTPDIFLCHGTVKSDLRYFLHNVDQQGVHDAPLKQVEERLNGRSEKLVLCGHSHAPRAVMLPGGQTVANPGSVGLQAYEWDWPHYHRMENASPDARYAIVDEPSLYVELIAVAYDHDAAAQKADREGRPDWAIALRTGRME